MDKIKNLYLNAACIHFKAKVWYIYLIKVKQEIHDALDFIVEVKFWYKVWSWYSPLVFFIEDMHIAIQPNTSPNSYNTLSEYCS